MDAFEKPQRGQRQVALVWLGQQREHTHGPARASLELDRRHDEERTGLWKLAQVRQIFEMIQTRSQRQMMNGI